MGEAWTVKVRFTRPALADLDNVSDYLGPRSPLGLSRVLRRIRSLIETLPDHPYLGKQTVDPTIRRLTASPYPYLVFYEVTDTEIIVHAVRHGARDPGTMPG